MSTTEMLKPAKGLRFRHASKRKPYHFGPGEAPLLEMRVTAVQKGMVHVRGDDYNKYRIPVEAFQRHVGEVLEVPEKPVKLSPVEYEALHRKAHAAGYAAGLAALPTPMVVQRHAHPLDDSSPVVQQWRVDEGACGFAWVWTPGDTPFARWARRQRLFGSHYGGGVALWVRHFGQSVERKEAYADAYAAVLREAGIKAFGQSRLD